MNEQDIAEFIGDYDNLSVNGLMKKYRLSRNEYNRLRNNLNLSQKKRVFEHCNSSHNGAKYYYKKDDKYIIRKKQDGKMKYFATCYSKDVADRTVELLKQSNWDKSKLDDIKKELDYETNHIKHRLSNIDFEQFKSDYDKLNREQLFDKYGLTLYKYGFIKKHLGLDRKKYVSKEE